MAKPHLLLKNSPGVSHYFNRGRNIEDEAIEAKPPEAYQPHKAKLAADHEVFIEERRLRLENRSFEIQSHIEYIEVDFFMVFSNSDKYKTRTQFFNMFGLVPVTLTNFNRTVLFAIANHQQFEHFIALLKAYIDSSPQTNPMDKEYRYLTLIHSFRFLTSKKIRGYCNDDVVLDLVNNDVSIDNAYSAIKIESFKYLSQLKKEGVIADFKTDEESSIEIKRINQDILEYITDNFDILCRAQSLRTVTIKPGVLNSAQLSWNLEIGPPEHQNVIAVLDNGIREIPPLEKIIIADGHDVSNPDKPDALKTNHTHGTVVASLAAVGTELFQTEKNSYTADAWILPVKILKDFEGNFNIYDIISVIRETASKGVRIFNLSVCGPGKSYNSVNSVFAYQLDKLAYEYDILIFIAAGNLDENDIKEMQRPEHVEEEFHQYPNHFYDPEKLTDVHCCEATNICIPAESMNNITVGATAENFRPDTQTHLTLSKELPAFYTRKHHIDYLAEINGSGFSKNQINRNVNKPDIVMPGGDRLLQEAAMQVLGFGDSGTDFYNYDSGTSLATPLAANLAAKILNKYPSLNMQSVKALIINGSEVKGSAVFLEPMIMRIKDRLSQAEFGKGFEKLSKGEKTKISGKIGAGNLMKNLVGYGTPNQERVLFSDDKSVTLIVEDAIEEDTHKAIPLNIPAYLLQGNQDKRLKIKATLCFKTFPVWGDQLGYNPLHISFNFARSVVRNDPEKGAEIIANNKHEYFEQFYQGPEIINEEDGAKKIGLKAEARKEALGIKKTLGSWSEDFFPAVNKPFSNTQQLTIHIRKEEISKIDCQLLVVVRCILKPYLDFKTQAWKEQQQSHPFSLILNIEEETKEFKDVSLYDELRACNQLEVAGDLSIDTDTDLGAELE